MGTAQVTEGSLAFSLVAGGPCYRLGRALRLIRDQDRDVVRLSLAAVVITWSPLAILSLVERLATGRASRLLVDLAVEARLLVAIPLLFVAERVLHLRTRRCVDRFQREGVADPDDDQVRRFAAATARVRDSFVPELILLALAVSAGFMVAGGMTGRTGLIMGVAESIPASIARIWYALVAFPVFLFLQGRAVWWWLLWCHLLWRLSRLRVQPMASHPDQKGGLGFLAEPSVGFAPVVSSVAAIAAASWAELMLAYGASAAVFVPQGALLVVLALLVTLGPLALFSGHMQRARFQAVRDYGVLALDYSRAFHRRWIGPRDEEKLLGSSDIQSLADLANAYTLIRSMRILPFGARSTVLITAAALAPMAPLLLLEAPLLDIARKLVRLLIGGIPG